MEKNVLVLLVTQREGTVPELQKIFTKYGSLIKTRLGIHDNGSEGADCGLIILELIGDKLKKEEFQKAVLKLEGIKSKLVSFSI
jgi:hypothetical protein